MTVITTKNILGVDKKDFRHPPVDLKGLLRQVAIQQPLPEHQSRFPGVMERLQEAVKGKEVKGMAPPVHIKSDAEACPECSFMQVPKKFCPECGFRWKTK